MNRVVLQEMTHQEMREANGGCCLLKLILKLLCCKPKPVCPKPTDPGNPGGGTGEN